jgi:hypothetical protein
LQLLHVTRKTFSGSVAYVDDGPVRAVSLMPTVVDMPSVKSAGLTREFSRNGPLGLPATTG